MVNYKRLLFLLLILLGLPLSVYLVLHVTKFFGKAGGVKADLLIDAGSSFSVPGGTWKNLAQGGEEKGRILLSVVGKIASLKPEYIRIDHIFDNYDIVKRDGSGNLTFNWSELDLTLGDIKRMGARPFIAVSYMPPAISRGDIVELPTNWGEWEICVQKLIEHISGKGGLNINSVYYEVWNEPDLFGKFKVYGEKNYLDLYAHTVTGAVRARNVNYFKIGGPATTGFYKNWFKALIKMAGRGVRLDFLSWHRYSKDLGVYENDYLEARRMLDSAENLKNVELLITESGPNSENDKVYDNSFGAIHTLALNAYLEGNARRSFIFEIKDGPGPEKFWGRWGILSHEKFGEPEAKPRYYAIQFLNRMTGKKVNVAGVGSWVKAFAKEEGNVIKTFVVNYDPRGTHYEAVPLTFINLPTGTFTFKRIDYGGETEELSVATTSATWKTIQEFKPNSAAIFEIIPVK